MSIDENISFVSQKVHNWVKKGEVDSGKRVNVPAGFADKVEPPARQTRKLRQASDIRR